MVKTNKNFLFVLVSGIIGAVAYSYSNAGFLMLFSFLPLFFGLARLSSAKKRDWFYFGLTAGLIYFLFVTRWFWSLYPLSSLGIQSKPDSIIVIFSIWVLVSLSMAVFWGLFCFVVGFLRSRPNYKYSLPEIMWIPSLFVILDYLRSYVIAIIGYGPGSLFGAHWTFGNLAYSLSSNNLALLSSSFVGVYGVTFLIILINVCLYQIIVSKNRSRFFIALLLLLALTIGDNKYTPDQVTHKKVSFVVIQTDHENKLDSLPKDDLNSFQTELALFDKAIKEHPETKLLIFPENTDFLKNLSLFLATSQIKSHFMNLAKDVAIVDSEQVTFGSKQVYSRIISVDSQQNKIGFYDKKLLVPGGEYLPYLVRVFGEIFWPKTKQVFESRGNHYAGMDEKITRLENFSLATAACSDLLSPRIIRDKAQNSDLLIGLASTSIFHGSETITSQNLAINKFRAAENGVSLLLAANSGPSYALDWRGNITAMASDGSAQILTGEISMGANKSWYNRVGDWPVFLTSIVILLIALILPILFKVEP